jgi:hypothetical protein
MKNVTPTHPYTLEVHPGPMTGTVHWAIRRDGKLVQRSDKIHRSEADARKCGLRQIERQFATAQMER